MRLLATILAVAAAMTLAACAKPQPDATVRAFYDAVRTGDTTTMRTLAAPELYTSHADVQLLRLSALMPKAPPTQVRVITRKVDRMVDAGETLDARELYTVESRPFVVAAQLYRATAKDPWKVRAFAVNAVRAADIEANAFKVDGKPLGQLAFLGGMVLSPVLMIAAFVRVLGHEGLRQRWLWGLLCFAGAITFHMNWTTGAFEINWLTIQLIGLGVTNPAPGLAPWILTLTLPLGALVILTGGLPARPRREGDREGS